MFFKIGVLKNIANFIGKTSVLEYLLNKVAGPQTLLKRDPNTGVFRWNLQNFQEHTGGCFWILTNVFNEKVFTLQLSNILPGAIWKTILSSPYRKKLRWERSWQLKSCSGNDPGESFSFWGNSLQIVSFLTRCKHYIIFRDVKRIQF